MTTSTNLHWHYNKPKVIGDYRLERSIGKGTFAHVYLARNLITDSNVAVKIVDKNKIDPENLRKTFRELSIMKQLIHPNVIRLYQVIETDLLLCLVTEYVSRGELYTHLKNTGKLTEADARVKFQQMTAAVAYCHASGICHRDLKAENILLDANMNIKLADFGFSNYFTSGDTLKTCCGSPPYASPELFQGLEYDGFKTDVWSLGVLLYILVTGGFPFPGSSYENLRLAVLRCNISIPYFVSIECNDLIRRMLVADPKRRYSIQDVVKHRWFTAEIDDDTSTLIRSSLIGKVESDVIEPIQESVVLLLQQKGFTLEQIADSVQNRRFDGVFAAYQLLHDRLKRKASQTVTRVVNLAMEIPCKSRVSTLRNDPDQSGSSSRLSVTDSQTATINIAPRRGSITTGLASVGPESNNEQVSTTQISVADVLVLNRSSPPDAGDSEDQNMSGEDSQESASSGSEDQAPYEPPPSVLKRYLNQRRHTLGYPLADVAQIPTSAALGASGSNEGSAGPYPFQQLAGFVGQEQSHLLRQPPNVNPLLSPLATHNLLLGYNQTPVHQYNPLVQLGMPFGGADRLNLPSPYARRASDSSRLLKPSGSGRFTDGPRLSSQDILRLSSNASSATGFGPSSETLSGHPNVIGEDEDLMRYLSSRNSSKRHTIHAAQPLHPAVSPTRDIQRLSNHHSSHRHHHSQPYPARRCSDGSGGQFLGSSVGSQLPPSVLAHLEKLHNQALGHCDEPVGFGSGSLRSLHQEFSQLISSSELNHQLQMMQLQSSSSQMTTGNSSTGSDKISARASPPTQNLHVISEVDDNLHSTTCSFPNDGKLTVDPINFSNKSEWDRPNDTAVDSSGPLISNERPIINITDESGTLLSSQKASPDPSLYAGSVQIVSNPYDTGTIQRPFLNGGSGNYMEPTGLSQFETQQLMSASLPFQSISMGLAQSPPYSSQFANLYEQGAQRILDRNAFAEYNGYQPAVDVNRLNEIFLQALEAQSQFHPGLFDGASGPREVALTNHNQQPNGESQFGRDTNMMEETVEDCSDEDQIFRTSLNLLGLENKVRRVMEQLNLSFVEMPNSSGEDLIAKSFSLRNQQRKLRLNTDGGTTEVNVILAPEFTQGISGVKMLGTTVNFQHVCGSRERYRKVCSDLVAGLSAM